MHIKTLLPNIPDIIALESKDLETIRAVGFVSIVSLTKRYDIYYLPGRALAETSAETSESFAESLAEEATEKQQSPHLDPTADQYFFIDRNLCLLGSGTFGSVYIAFPIKINTQENQVDNFSHMNEEKSGKGKAPIEDEQEQIYQQYKIDKSNPVALKISPFDKSETEEEQEKFLNNEIMITNQLYQMWSNLGRVRRTIPSPRGNRTIVSHFFFIMKYFDGDALATLENNNKLLINPELLTLSFDKRVNSLLTLALTIEQLLNFTPTSLPTLHCDLKPDNVILTVEKDELEKIETVTLSLVDFGLAKRLQKAILTQMEAARGTLHTMAPEMANKRQAGPRSEVYSFLGILLIVLGVPNPFLDKLKPITLATEVPNTPYNFKGLLENIVIPGQYPKLIKKLISTFAFRMGSQEYADRSSFNEVVMLLMALRTYCKNNKIINKLQQFPSELKGYSIQSCREAVLVSLAKMALLATGLWFQKIGDRMIPDYYSSPSIKKFFTSAPMAPITFAEFPFVDNIKFCQGIINAFKKRQLDCDFIKFALLETTFMAESIHEVGSTSSLHRIAR